MKILAVQGSPRPKTGNTDIVLQEFLRGAENAGALTRMVYLKEKNIHHCTGCLACWEKTPGECVLKDDMPVLLQRVKEADVLVLATPLYVFNMSSLLKVFLERLLPLDEPRFVKEAGTYRHPPRYGRRPSMVFVATCGLSGVAHFDGLRRVLKAMERASNMPLVGEVLVPNGPLLQTASLEAKVREVLDAVYRAGLELVRKGKVSKETELSIQKPLMAEDEYVARVNAFWDKQTPAKR
jgi:putative NADPH-quinone reductase